MKNIIIFLMALFVLLTLSCSSDNITNSSDNKPKLQATIGPAGGEVGDENFKFIVPAGAFESSTTISVVENADDILLPENQFSSIYQISGIPTTYNQPLKILLKHNNTLSDSSFIAHINQAEVLETDTLLPLSDLYFAKDSAGFLIAEIPANGSSALSKSMLCKLDENITHGFFAVTAFMRTEEIEKWNMKMQMEYPAFMNTFMDQFASDLYKAFTTFQDMAGYQIHLANKNRQLTEMKIQVEAFPSGYDDLKILSQLNQTETAFKAKFSLNIKYAMTFYQAEMQLKSAQALYGLLLELHNFDNEYSHYNKWFNTAAVEWIGKKFIDNEESYIPESLPGHEITPFNGIFIGNFTNTPYYNINNSALGMSSFVRYIEKHHSEPSISNIYWKYIRNDYHIMDAIMIEVPNVLTNEIADYFQELLEGKLYSVSESVFIDAIKNSDTETLSPDKSFSVQDNFLDLSARLYRFTLDNEITNEHTIELTSQNADGNPFGVIIVFGSTGDKLAFISKGTGLVTLSAEDLYTDGYSEIIVAVVNTNITVDSDNWFGNPMISFNAKVLKQNSFNYNFGSIQIEVTAEQYNPFDQDSEVFSSITFSGPGEMKSENEFEVSYDNPSENYPTYHTDIYIKLDPTTGEIIEYSASRLAVNYEGLNNIWNVAGTTRMKSTLSMENMTNWYYTGTTACSYIDDYYYNKEVFIDIYHTEKDAYELQDFGCTDISKISIVLSYQENQ